MTLTDEQLEAAAVAAERWPRDVSCLDGRTAA